MIAAIALLPLLASTAVAWNSDNHTCSILPKYRSCELPKDKIKTFDTCCTPVQGLVLVTQYWNTVSASGTVLLKDGGLDWCLVDHTG